MAPHKETKDANGMVALSICESLLLALTDLKVIRGQDVHDLLWMSSPYMPKLPPTRQHPKSIGP